MRGRPIKTPKNSSTNGAEEFFGTGRAATFKQRTGRRQWPVVRRAKNAQCDAHLTAAHLAPYAEHLCAGGAVAAASDGTLWAQGRKKQGLALLQALEMLVGRVGIEPTTNGLRV